MTKCKAIIIAAVIGLLAATAQADVLYRAGFNDVLDHIDTTTFNIDQSVPKEDNIYSLAMQPGTNTLFGVVDGDGLVTVDPVTGDMNLVVQMLDPTQPYPYFSSITFAPDGSLYTVATPSCGWTPGMILEVDMDTGVLTETGGAGGGHGGQGIEFNPDDGLLYHFYNDDSGGGGTAFLETIDPLTGDITDIPLSGYDHNVVNGQVYAGDGKFYAYDNKVGDLLEITTGGVVTLLHAYGEDGKYAGLGLAMDTYVPEPASLSLLVFGGLLMMRRRR